MTHYETLGLKENATADEIKRAYRAKAKEKHPDKGGDPGEFTPIAHAYEVLSNPERKLLYDATGSGEPPRIEKDVQEVLMNGFSQALQTEEDVEILAFVRDGLESVKIKIESERTRADARKKTLKAKRERTSSTNAANLIHQLIDEELRRIDGLSIHLDYQAELNEACFAALESYSEKWEEPPPPVYFRQPTFSIRFED